MSYHHFQRQNIIKVHRFSGEESESEYKVITCDETDQYVAVIYSNNIENMLPVIPADNIEKATSGTVVVKTQSKRTADEADDDDGIVLCHKSCL